ncbi:MAG TPA: hypothetical protein ENH13_03675 [Euryarchaeota archaeon]|nr:hypothetical protein BMS3Bbin16_00990 [archaeon BMS3Bbin16]HDH28213.1 hypothetical protein [Euryarchaeota archaeon]
MAFLDINDNRAFNNIHEFVDFLCTERDLTDFKRKLHVVGAISKFESLRYFKESLRRFKFGIDNEYGNLLLISKKVKDTESVFYVYVFFDDRNNIPLFFTQGRKSDEIPTTIIKYISRTKNITHLWIGPHTLKKIKDELLDKYPDSKISYFTGKNFTSKTLNEGTGSLVRPDIKRLIRYKGRDGKETLEEFETIYGIFPRVIEFELSNGLGFRIDNKGIVTLNYGNFRDVFQILQDDVIRKIEVVRQAVNQSEYTITEIQTKSGNMFERPIQKPWSIQLAKPLDFGVAKKALIKLEEDEWNFTVFNEVLMEGSVYLSARLVDNNKHSKFEILSAGEKINIYPIDNVDIGSAITFFAFVSENIDPQAIPIIQ